MAKFSNLLVKTGPQVIIHTDLSVIKINKHFELSLKYYNFKWTLNNELRRTLYLCSKLRQFTHVGKDKHKLNADKLIVMFSISNMSSLVVI